MTKKCTHTDGWQQARVRATVTQRRLAIERRERYNRVPQLCERCKVSIPFDKRRNKYCSQSCAAVVNNAGKNRHTGLPSVARLCVCGNTLSWRNGVYCSRQCYLSCRRKIFDDAIKAGQSSDATLRRYLLRNREHRCEICRLTEWQNKPIPLDVDHRDGNPKNNADDNLRLLCKNCHAQTPTYGAKNKGNGRQKRREFYQQHGYN